MNISPVRGTAVVFEPCRIDDAIEQLLAGKGDRLAAELQIQKALNCLERPSNGLVSRIREAGYLITYHPETIARFKSFYLRGNSELTQAIQSATERGGLLVDGFKMYRPGPASCSHLNGAAKGYDEIFALFETHTNEKERIGKDTLEFLHLLEKHLPTDHPWKAIKKVIDLGCGNGVQTEKICMTGWEIIGIDNQAGCIEKCQSFLPQHQFIQHDILQAAPALLTKTAAVVFVSHFYCSPAQAASFVQNLKDYQASDNSLVIFVNGCEGTDADELCHKLPFLRGKPSSQMSEEFQKALNQFGYNCISFVREAKVFFPPLTTEIEETLLTIQRSDYENPYLGIDENTKVFKGLMEFIASFPLEAMTTEQISAYLEALKNTFAKNHGNFLKICNKMVIAHPKKADAAFKAAFEQAQTEEASGYELELIDEKVAQGFFKEAKDMLGRRIQKTKENALFVHLGEICLQEGQYPEAAVVFWYAKRLGLQVDGKIEQVEKELLFKHHSQVGEYRGLGQANLDRKQLEAFRQKINEEYQLLATQPFGLEKAEGLRTIYSHVTQGIKAFVATLSEDVIQQLETWGHSLPCEYAIMGLGSLAREEMTPYSDLEFAILVASEEEGVKNYFRLFTYLLHLRVINLGETILPALDMSALNWLYDDLTPRGISFDGSMPTACKTPLGKQKGRLGDFELIHTPTKMSELQQIQENDPLKRLWVLKRYHLPTILSASTYIVGSPQGQTLVEEYQAQVRTFLSLGEGKKRALDLIEDDLSRFKPQLTEQENGKHYNVKKDLYRLPNTMFDGLANYFNLVSTSTWERIEELEKRNLLCPEGANNLKLLTMGAQELRLATYLKHDRQKEHLDLDEHKENLHKIYYISLAFTKVMEQFCNLLKENQNPENLLSTSTFKDKSAYHSGLIHMRHLDYLLAEQAFEEDVSEQEYYKIRADLKVILGKYTQAIESYQKALALSETPELWKKLGKAYQNQALYPQAEEAFLQGLACIHASYQRYLKEEVLLEANTFDGWSKIARCYIQERKLYLTTPLAKPSVAKIDQVFLEFEKIYLALAELYKITAHYSQARAALNMCKKLAYERTKMLEKDPEYQVIVDLDLAELYKVEASIAKDLDSQFEKGENLIQQAKHILIAYYKREDHPKVFECEMLLNLPLGKSLEILQLMQKLFGDGHPNLATIYHSIGFVLHHQGKYEEALQNYTQALEMRKKLFGEDHLDVAASYNDIGLVLHHQGKYKEASQHYAQALKIGEKLLGEKHPHVATSYCNIGSVLHHQGKYEEALQHYTQALEMGKKLLGEEHPTVATRYNNIGSILEHQGKYKEALQHYTQALEMGKKLLGEEHPAVTTTYGNIGLVLHHQGKYEEASQHYTQALEMEKKLLGEEHVALATTYSNIGSVLNAQGKYEEALRHHTQALEIRKKLLGEEHPDVAASYNSIGLILDYQSKHEEALQHYAQALEMQKQLLGEEHPDVAATYSNIGGALQSQGKHEAALQHYTQALEMQKKLLGKEHLILATTYNNIGSVLSHQGKYEEALQYYAQALEMQKKLLGKEHPNVATSYHNIGGVLHSQSKHKKALRYCTQALEMRKKLLGEEHPDVASSYNNISAMHFHLAQTYKRVSPAESLKHAQKAKKHLQKYEDLQLWGKNQPQIQTFLRNKQYNKAIRSIHTLPNSLKKRPFVLCPYLQLSFVCENQKVKRLRSQILEQAEKACQTGKLKASLSLRLNLALIYIQANDWDKALKHIRMLKSCQDAITYSSLDLLLMQEDPNLAGETVPAEIMGDYLALRVFEFKGANLVVKMGCQNLLKKIESLKNKNLLIKRFERFCLDKLNS